MSLSGRPSTRQRNTPKKIIEGIERSGEIGELLALLDAIPIPALPQGFDKRISRTGDVATREFAPDGETKQLSKEEYLPFALAWLDAALRHVTAWCPHALEAGRGFPVESDRERAIMGAHVLNLSAGAALCEGCASSGELYEELLARVKERDFTCDFCDARGPLMPIYGDLMMAIGIAAACDECVQAFGFEFVPPTKPARKHPEHITRAETSGVPLCARCGRRPRHFVIAGESVCKRCVSDDERPRGKVT